MAFGNVSRKDHSPIYCQIAENLRGRIFGGELEPMSKLPAEDELCGLYGASRVTIRSALKKLESEGLVHKVNGKGTFVARIKGKQRQIILVLENGPDVERHLHELVMGALVQAQDDGFSVLVANRAQLRGFLEEAASCPSRQTGVLVLRCRGLDSGDLDFAEKHGVPCLLEGCERLKGRNWLAVDNAAAMRQVVDHLHGLGRRRFGVFNAELPFAWSSFKERHAAALARLAELGISGRGVTTVSLPVKANTSVDAYGLTAKFFKSGTKPDAIICVSDMIAAQVLKWLASNGLKVPEDVAVTGFDDILLASYTTPPLTTVRQNYYDTGAAAAARLRSMMDDADNKRVQIVRKLELVVRESTIA